MANVVKFQQLSTDRQSEWIDRLFARMSAMYGNRFASMWDGQPMQDVKAVWREDLAEFTPAEIAAGVAACKAREWPPTLPEFIRLCRPSLDYERAFYDAVEQMRRRDRGEDRWTFPAIYWAAVSIGRDVMERPYSDLRTRWAKAVDDAILDIREGKKPDSVPERRAALPEPGKATLDRETVQENLARLKAMVVIVAKTKTLPDESA